MMALVCKKAGLGISYEAIRVRRAMKKSPKIIAVRNPAVMGMRNGTP
jgi:hypothetical protein